MRQLLALLAASPILLAGCLTAPRGAAKVQEAAIDLNVNARFGRMEIATEHVSTKGRDDFFGHRKGWGGNVRLADTEVANVHLTGDEDAEVMVRVAWYRADEGELHVTALKQKWHLFNEDWKLIAETRTDGDIGLIGEQIATPADAPKRSNAQFPTIRIGAAD